MPESGWTVKIATKAPLRTVAAGLVLRDIDDLDGLAGGQRLTICYPWMKPGDDTRGKYCSNLEVMRKYSLQRGIPFWNYFNTMPFSSHYDPTEAQLRWQIYTSIAYGARGVMYFCYQTPRGHIFSKGGAILTHDERRAVLLNNYSFAYTAWPTVAFDVPVEQVREVCRETGSEISPVDDSPRIDGLQISLDSAEGRLFLLAK